MSSVAITLIAGAFVALTLILWRVWPVLWGRARAKESRAETLNRWNVYIAPMLRKHSPEDTLVGLAGTFKSTRDGEDYTSVTWSLHPSIMPDVDYVALAPPVEEGDREIVGFIQADRLREHLGSCAQSQQIFGHTAWIYLWPEEMDYRALVKSCASVAEFLVEHGLSSPQTLESA